MVFLTISTSLKHICPKKCGLLISCYTSAIGILAARTLPVVSPYTSLEDFTSGSIAAGYQNKPQFLSNT